MVWKFCEIWKVLQELASRWAKFCEIVSRSARYGMYGRIETGLVLKAQQGLSSTLSGLVEVPQSQRQHLDMTGRLNLNQLYIRQVFLRIYNMKINTA